MTLYEKVMASLLLLIAGAAWQEWVFGSRRGTLHHACEQACTRLGSEVEHLDHNLCVCTDMTVMRGDYGMLFLGGERN